MSVQLLREENAVTKRLTAREWAERRQDRKTKPCIIRGCQRPGTRLGLCRQCYRWHPYDNYIQGAEPTERKLRSDGYVDIKVDGLWCMEHRAIIMREEGRRLSHAELVRHLDENRSNNERSNLLLTSRKDPALRRQREDTGDGTAASADG